MSRPTVTGRRETREGWIGTWEGDPTSGSVQFRMTAEGDVEARPWVVRTCEPPHRLVVASRAPYDGDDVVVVAHGGGEAATVVWDDYYPWMSEPYATMFGTLGT